MTADRFALIIGALVLTYAITVAAGGAVPALLPSLKEIALVMIGGLLGIMKGDQDRP